MNEKTRCVNDTTLPVERVRQACIEAAKKAYEDAGISGLCAEGRWECALQAMHSVNLDTLEKGSYSPQGVADA